MNDDHLPVTIVLPVYAGDSPPELRDSLKSLCEQSKIAAELLVVEDGPIPNSLDSVIKRASSRYPGSLNRLPLKENRGLPTALREGVEAASYELLARMDSDDISREDRIAHQYGFLERNPDVDVVGGQLVEIDPKTEFELAERRVPLTHADIERMAKKRSPMNHGTVMMRRSSVLGAGNYRPIRRMEDYDLWVRMMLNGSRFANIDEVLLEARAGEELSGRRGGIEYAIEEVNRQLEFLKRGFIGRRRFILNTVLRGGLRLAPRSIRAEVYRRFARAS